MTSQDKESFLIQYVKDNDGIENCFGHFKFTVTDRIGQGGNGVVYSAIIENKGVAIKFLITDSSKKGLRFKSEFFNTNYVRAKLSNIVNMIHYDELNTENDISIPYIVMSRYKENLRKSRKTVNQVSFDELIKLKDFLFETIKSLHDNGIIHRDIKPENILIDENGNYFLSDFGIAHFDDSQYPIDNKTNKSERLANIEFSAPEQIDNSSHVTEATDIYSLAQVLYWFIFNKVNRGTGGEYIASVFVDEDAYIYDEIIYKCINNNPEERFQSINEIETYFNQRKFQRKEIDPFNDMYQFSRAIRSVVPEFYNRAYCIDNKDEMEKLFAKIFSQKYNKDLEFNSGKGNNTIKSIIRLENDDFLMDYRQLNIKRIWGLICDDVYDDILLLELEKSKPYIINGKEYYHVAKINDDEIIPYSMTESGYVRYKDSVVSTQEIKIQERYIGYNYNAIVIAPFHSCCVIPKNDEFICEMQSNSPIEADDIYKLKKKIHMNRTRDVSMRL